MLAFEPTAKVIADSISPRGHRLTTLEVRFHRFLLAEFNMHRVFSRNSASSRAIPVAKTMKLVADDPAVPVAWPAERKGMQGGAELPLKYRQAAVRRWLAARDDMVEHAEYLVSIGLHKSVANRLLEPFLPQTVIVSGTDWDGFWAQRCSPLAQPEIHELAMRMREAYEDSTPDKVAYGEWHLPYVDGWERDNYSLQEQCQISTARCARVSYLTHDGKRDPHRDLELYDRLVSADPPHASPLEHVATPMGPLDLPHEIPGNFTGWCQLRHTVLRA